MRSRSIYIRFPAPGAEPAAALAEQIAALRHATRAGDLRALVYGDEHRSIYCLEGARAKVEAEFRRATASASWSHPVVLDHRPALDTILPDRPLAVVPASAQARSVLAGVPGSEATHAKDLPTGDAAIALIEQLARLAG